MRKVINPQPRVTPTIIARKTNIKDYPQYYTPETVAQNSKLIALASSEQVRNGKSNKAPSINWETKPKDYTGLNDPKYGTSIVCDYLPNLNLYLVVIDLDKPKNEKHLKLKELKDAVSEIVPRTLVKQTPSGGWHIYLLSVEKPIAKQPSINIDYQTNTGKGRGKYVIMDYRWSPDGTKQQLYQQVEGSHDNIRVIPSSDRLLEQLMSNLNEKGLVSTPLHEKRDDLVGLFRANVREGTRQYYSCAIAGALRKNGYKKNAIIEIISKVFEGDPELEDRVRNVNRTFNKPLNDILGMKWLEDNLPPVDYQALQVMLAGDSEDLRSQIIGSLTKNFEPSSKVLADYINSKLDLYCNLETHKYYEKDVQGRYDEIDEKRIIEFVNDDFGYNTISKKRCHEVLKYITNPIRKNYDLIEFQNGILNTKTRYFTSDKEEHSETPKLTLPFNWNPDAEPGKIGEIIDQILDNPAHPEDKNLWIRAVGHAFMGDNRIGKMVLVQGPSGTGKSTLHSILKRCFNYSMTPTGKINANERFVLQSIVDKDINIDDDINNGMLTSIGNMNSIVTGEGLEVEVKGENRYIKCNNQMIPRLFAAGNSLPPVIGEGFERRLLLIHAENKITYDDRDDRLVADIGLGQYDKNGLEWLVHESINLYWENEDKPFTSQEQEEQMLQDFKFKSYPLKCAIEEIFNIEYDKYITSKEINRILRNWSIFAYNEYNISKEEKNPTAKKIDNAMNNCGFFKERIWDPNTGEQPIAYVDIQLKPEWEFLRRRSTKPHSLVE